MRFIIGKYGSGKSFLLQLIRGSALDRGFVCADADLSPERRICGAKELRVKESDRIKTTAQMIVALGGDCMETEDGFIIRGKKTLIGGRVDSGMDHRIAMSAAVAAILCRGSVTVEGSEAVEKSYPDFWRDYHALLTKEG